MSGQGRPAAEDRDGQLRQREEQLRGLITEANAAVKDARQAGRRLREQLAAHEAALASVYDKLADDVGGLLGEASAEAAKVTSGAIEYLVQSTTGGTGRDMVERILREAAGSIAAQILTDVQLRDALAAQIVERTSGYAPGPGEVR